MHRKHICPSITLIDVLTQQTFFYFLFFTKNCFTYKHLLVDFSFSDVATWEGAALRDWKVHPQKGQTLAKLLAVVEGLLQCTCTYYEYKVQLYSIM